LEPVLASLLEESFSARLASSTGVNDEERQTNGVAVSVNPLYAAGSSLHAAFVAACRRNLSLEVEVVFHGTADRNVDAISENGLDPARRGQHGQSLGPGEYFARDPLISLSYCQWGGGFRPGAGPTRMLIFAVLIDPRNDGVPAFAREDFGGSSPIVVVPEADHQLPIGVLTLRPGEEAMGQATSVVNALMRKAKAASDAAAVAEKQASAAESFARVCQLLIREDLDAAAAAYQAAIASDAAVTSSWAHALSFYLRKYRLEPSLVQAMFPGVEGVEVDAGGSSSGGLGSLGSASRTVSKRPFDGTVEELKASATAKRAEADAAHSRWRAASSRAASSAGSTSARAVPGRNARPAAVASTAVATRRVTKELRQLARAEHGWTVELPDEANCYVWRVAMQPEPGTNLARELVDHARRTGESEAVQLEVAFSGDYPAAPPFVRVVSPRFEFHTGHVTVGGSVCLETLTTSGWNSELSMEGVLLLVRSAFADGGGRLDPVRAHVPYAEREARAAFERVARAHGWGA